MYYCFASTYNIYNVETLGTIARDYCSTDEQFCR